MAWRLPLQLLLHSPTQLKHLLDKTVELNCDEAVAVEGAEPSVSGFELAALSAKVFEFGIW